MSRRKILGLAMLLGFVIGGTLGYYAARTFTRASVVLGNMTSAAGYGNLAYMQYRHATPERAREALLGFVDYSKSLETMPDGEKDKVLLRDRALSYMRLALLEEKAGNINLSRQYAQAAQESFTAGGGRTSSGEELRTLVTTLDARIKY